MNNTYKDLKLTSLEDINIDTIVNYILDTQNKNNEFDIALGAHIGWKPFFGTKKNIYEFLRSQLNDNINPYEYVRVFEHIKEIEIMKYLKDNEILTLLLLPKYSDTPFIKDFIEYINQVTEGSKNFIYLQSTEDNEGYISEKTKNKLEELCRTLEQRNDNVSTLLFGGQVGNCLLSANEELESVFKKPDINIIPDYTVTSLFDFKWGTDLRETPQYTENIEKIQKILTTADTDLIEQLKKEINNQPEINKKIVSGLENLIRTYHLYANKRTKIIPNNIDIATN